MGLFTGVLGGAGTGKSTRIKDLIELDPQYALPTSTSGISAVHLKGSTVNSTLGYFDTEELIYKLADGSLLSTLKAIKKKYNRLLIDEISMMDGMQLNCIVKAIKLYNERHSSDPLGLEVSGDFGQLAAVRSQTARIKAIPAFQSKFWNEFDIEHLTKVHRQSNPEFIEALRELRLGNAEAAADWLDTHIGFEKKLDPDFVGTTILSKNKEVDQYNYTSLKKVDSVSVTYYSKVKGIPKPEWKQIPEQVTLKPGCTVILLNNKLPEYANGDLATVKEVFTNTDAVLVELNRTKTEHIIAYNKLSNIPIGTDKEVGTISYLPVRLSYALTVHKTQGLTLEKVQLDFRNNFWKILHGGLYVACSRIKDPSGLRLVGTKDQFIKACYVDPLYKPFIN